MPVAVVINGEQMPPAPSTVPDHLWRAASDVDVAEVLGIMGPPDPLDWIDLCRVLEIIEHSGRRQIAMDAAGISKKQVDVFSQTANHPQAAGPAARHARSKYEPPKHPMPIALARQLISKLVCAWLDTDARSAGAASAEDGSS
jgi:hypothetical protein